MICKHCKEPFDHTHPRHKALGKINECGDCVEDDVEKTVGIIDGHGKSDVRVILQRSPKAGINSEVMDPGA